MCGGKKLRGDAASSISTNWRDLSGSGGTVRSGRRAVSHSWAIFGRVFLWESRDFGAAKCARRLTNFASASKVVQGLSLIHICVQPGTAGALALSCWPDIAIRKIRRCPNPRTVSGCRPRAARKGADSPYSISFPPLRPCRYSVVSRECYSPPTLWTSAKQAWWA